MKLGIGTYTFGWAIGAPSSLFAEHELLDYAMLHSLKVVQIGDNLPLDSFDKNRLAQLAELALSRNLSLEVGARRLTAERVQQYAEIARFLGARLIRFVIDDVDYHPSPAAVTAILQEAAPMLSGLVLGIENHDRFSAHTLRDIIERAGNPRIGVCLDTANSLGAGEGIDGVAETLAPLTVNLHIKDFWIERVPHLMGFTVTGRVAGTGMLNVQSILNLITPHARCETAILELWTPPEARIEDTIAKEARWAEESLTYLKPLFHNRYA